MFILEASKNRLTRRSFEPLTSGSVAVYTVRFTFSPDWDGLTRTACFKSGTQIISVLLGDSNECTIPWEVTGPESKGKVLYVGVYGTKGSSVALPTVWASLGIIHEGVECGADAIPPTPALWEQELDRKGDTLAVTEDGALGLYAGDKLLSAVSLPSGECGASDHRLLTMRDAAEQHPIQAIAGLERELSRRATADDTLSVVDIINIMEG